MENTINLEYTKSKNDLLKKKIGFFNSGMVPLERYERDMHLIKRLKPPSLRVDLFMGDRGMEFGDLVDGKPENIIYNYDKFDRFIGLLKRYEVAPYISWCYIPLPLQPADGDFRSYPTDEKKYFEIIKTLSSHLKNLMGDGLYYEEIYNEADCEDVFFRGTFGQFLRLYELGATAVKEAGSTALIGGPAEAYVMNSETVKQNMQDFLEFVNNINLPMDFFSFHSYGWEKKEYLNRTHEVLELLKRCGDMKSTELHINELNVVKAPWKLGETILETPEIIPLIFTMIDELSQIPEVTLIHWAQFLASGVDALGLVDVEGKLMPAFFAFEIFSRMPESRMETEENQNIGCLASADKKRLSAVLWNKSDTVQELKFHMEKFPEEFAISDLYILDDKFWELHRQFPQLTLDAALREKIDTAAFLSIKLSPDDVIYIESNSETE